MMERTNHGAFWIGPGYIESHTGQTQSIKIGYGLECASDDRASSGANWWKEEWLQLMSKDGRFERPLVASKVNAERVRRQAQPLLDLPC
jgi:hypothetical protein